MSFLFYQCKAAIAIAVFYAFFRILFKGETFHRLNRILILGGVIAALIIPFCSFAIPVHELLLEPNHSLSIPDLLYQIETDVSPILSSDFVSRHKWIKAMLLFVYWSGSLFVISRLILSIGSIAKLIHNGSSVSEDDGLFFIITDRINTPFSWMHFVFLPKSTGHSLSVILTHEKTHVKNHHSLELLFIDLISAIQWFNPIIWCFRKDLQEIHEYEADEAVLKSGANIKDYQYLLLNKAVGKRGIVIANSLNHSALKNRITMMTKPRTTKVKLRKLLYFIPALFLCLFLQARPEYDFTGNMNEGFITLELKATGLNNQILLNEKVALSKEEVSKLLITQKLRFPGKAMVRIVADPSVNMSQVEDLKESIRDAGIMKVIYSSSKTGTSIARYLWPTIGTPGIEVNAREHLFDSVNPDYICPISIQSSNIYYDNQICVGDKIIKDRGEEFISKNRDKTIFLFNYDGDTCFEQYHKVYSLLYMAYSKAREKESIRRFGIPFKDLSITEKSIVKNLLPINIVELASYK